jgi:hypothetical protein
MPVANGAIPVFLLCVNLFPNIGLKCKSSYFLDFCNPGPKKFVKRRI